jgi:hypothetical protein
LAVEMNRRQSFFVTVASALLLGCTPPTDPGHRELVGRWITAPADLSPSGWHQYHLTFSANGRFAAEARSFGLYSGQRRDGLSAYSRTEGAFRTEDDRLVFEPVRLVWWDAFYGIDSPEHVQEPYPYMGFYDDTHYVVAGRQLTLRYLSYPADAPVPTMQTYLRAN